MYGILHTRVEVEVSVFLMVTSKNSGIVLFSLHDSGISQLTVILYVVYRSSGTSDDIEKFETLKVFESSEIKFMQFSHFSCK